jgi:predicted O-linked N-acetylglucosamine transferase (SPINDLY family)
MNNNLTRTTVTEKYLREGDYQELAQFYESLLEEEPDNIDNYWYLGLAYLLQGQEEDAQLTWFMVLNQLAETEIDENIQVLTEILDNEAKFQQKEQKIEIAWLIRGHIRELAPNNLANLIQLICLDIKIHNSDIEKFQSWDLAEILKSSQESSVSLELIQKAIRIILCLPCANSLVFAKWCLEYTDKDETIISAIVEIASLLVFKYGYHDHGVDLLKLCLEYKPNDLVLLKTLCSFYAEGKKYEQALSVAENFLNQCQSLSAQVFGNYQFLYIYLQSSNWFEVVSIAQSYIDLLEKLVEQETIVIDDFLIPNTSMLIQSLLYLHDQPRKNRYLFNKISDRFQQIMQNKFSELTKNSWKNELSKNRSLKIGYISSCFKLHSVAWLSRWLIAHHNKEEFEVYIYSMSQYSDWLTEQHFKAPASQFHAFDYNPLDAVAQIRADEIDILIDLDSVTSYITYQVMAFKPAPIQVTWLGYDASGISAIDYFIADPYVLPEKAQDYYSEKIWRLPQTYIGVDGFEVAVPSLKREELQIEKDAVIFMSIQGSLKRHPEIIRLQMRIIKNVPNSYLLLKGKGDPTITEQLYDQLAKEEGLETSRLRFLEMSPTELEHRADLSIADVVLDTYPYNGATTTLETLWMEIPLVTKVGEQFAARNSYSFMMNAGITEGIAWTDEEYVEWGVKLGTSPDLRKTVRWKLRQSKKTSPLWNGKKFTQEMEKAYQQMWDIYVGESSSMDA